MQAPRSASLMQLLFLDLLADKAAEDAVDEADSLLRLILFGDLHRQREGAVDGVGGVGVGAQDDLAPHLVQGGEDKVRRVGDIPLFAGYFLCIQFI